MMTDEESRALKSKVWSEFARSRKAWFWKHYPEVHTPEYSWVEPLEPEPREPWPVDPRAPKRPP